MPHAKLPSQVCVCVCIYVPRPNSVLLEQLPCVPLQKPCVGVPASQCALDKLWHVQTFMRHTYTQKHPQTHRVPLDMCFVCGQHRHRAGLQGSGTGMPTSHRQPWLALAALDPRNSIFSVHICICVCVWCGQRPVDKFWQVRDGIVKVHRCLQKEKWAHFCLWMPFYLRLFHQAGEFNTKHTFFTNDSSKTETQVSNLQIL